MILLSQVVTRIFNNENKVGIFELDLGPERYKELNEEGPGEGGMHEYRMDEERDQ